MEIYSFYEEKWDCENQNALCFDFTAPFIHNEYRFICSRRFRKALPFCLPSSTLYKRLPWQ